MHRSKFARIASWISPLTAAAVLFAAGCSDDVTAEGDETGETGETGTDGTDDEIGDEAETTGETEESTESTEDETSTDGTDETDSTDGTEEDTGTEEGGLECLNEQFVNGPSPGPDYTELDLTIGSHCKGTNHQDITDIERVVFIGDSVTVGSPPAGIETFYRSVLADELSMLFGIDMPQFLWYQYDPFNGTTVVKESGDFASCAEWGARNDDLQTQLDDCFSGEDFDKRTLIIFTMGGNDVSAMAQDAIEGATPAMLFEELESMLDFHRAAVDWIMEPDRFPNGVFIVNANVYEYTDYTADLLSCPAADLAGFNANPEMPDLLMASLNLINEEYAITAAESGTDVVFMQETFCGHGFMSDDPDNICYRGPGNANWFDLTCIHPTSEGHAAIADLFLSVITE